MRIGATPAERGGSCQVPRGSEFNKIVVALNKRNHAQQRRVARPRAEMRTVPALHCGAAPVPSTPPCLRAAPTGRDAIENIARRKLDFAQRQRISKAPTFFLRDRSVVTNIYLRIEAAGEHAIMVAHQLVADAHIVQAQARPSGKVAIALGVEASGPRCRSS